MFMKGTGRVKNPQPTATMIRVAKPGTAKQGGAAVVEVLKLFFAEEGVPLEIAGVIRSDNANLKEFAEGALPEFLKELGIGQEFSAPEEPEQNGVAKMSSSMIKHSPTTTN
eukprot:2245684-Rhodomonas_salina.1